MRTLSIKKNEIRRDWYVINAKDRTLGRLSSVIAHVIRGKNKVNFTPHVDMSDFVIVINADKIKKYISLPNSINEAKKYISEYI